MTDTRAIDLRSLETEARALRSAELRRIASAFAARLRRALQRQPAPRAA